MRFGQNPPTAAPCPAHGSMALNRTAPHSWLTTRVGVWRTALAMTSIMAFLITSPVSPALADEAEPGPSAEEAQAARMPVVQLEETLLSVMKRADELGFAGRLSEITPVVEATFDLPFMAKTSIGRIWKSLTPEVQTRWVQSFTRYTTSKLADQFDGFSGQEFTLKGERPASRGTLIVMTRVERPGKDPVRLDFRVRKAAESWLIIDIYGKGKVSEVALRRSEYAAILEDDGIEGLIASVDALSEKTASK